MQFESSYLGGTPPLFLMNTIVVSDRIQEDWPVKPGHCLNPFEPLFGSDTPESGLGRSLYDLAISIEESYGLGELMDELPNLVLGIKQNLTSWYEIGLISWKIKLCKAWRKRYSSFKQFCENAVGKTSSAVNNWIRAARVMSQLISAGCDRLPLNASIAIELSKFGETDLLEAWRDVCETYCDHELTLDKVKAHLENPYQRLPNSKKVNIPIELWERLREKAAESGLSPSKLLEELIESLLPDDDDPSRDAVPPDDEDEDDSQFECQLLNVFGDTKVSNQELENHGYVRVRTGVNSYHIVPVAEIPLDSSDNYESNYLRTENGEIIPRYAKRYRENFKIKPDGYYFKKDPVRSWELNGGILEQVPF
ncbi:hypothetical protein MiTs_04016 [Microcystis aeruginosa NIES-2521]|uniref:Uncharacterized protein n=2 Tax=Microcystis aeruginosa TaxID=1126 RepID=A0A5A5RZL3_MICAE|nr:hypothetical protein MiTs_04016 [Microcystis aeruginosa NIES-2521]